jgi:Polysulphide reductase
MFIERFLIVITGLRVPLMPYPPADYFPSWIEWSIFFGMSAVFALIITLAVKLFPMFAVWEMTEEYAVRSVTEELEATARAGVAAVIEGGER